MSGPARAAIRFIRKNGRVIPIRAAISGGSVVASVSMTKPKPAVRGNAIAKFASTALAVTGGFAAGASFGHGGSKVVGAHLANHVGDIASTGLAFGAFAGKGRVKDRLKAGADLEVKNQALGWTAYAVSALHSERGREAIVGYARKALGFGKQILKRAL